MTIAPLQLDDLTWEDMVAAIRRRIMAESAGQWTLHTPADPGITLLELFAFLAEQRLYWLDQVPDAFVVAVLNLLGLDGPQPAVPAATVLQISPAAGITGTTLAPGTEFSRDPYGQIVFTLDDPVTVLPVTAVSLETNGQDRTADLQAGREVGLLPADGGPGEASICLELSEPVPGGQQLSLLFVLDTSVPPAWHPMRSAVCRRLPGSPGTTPAPTRPGGQARRLGQPACRMTRWGCAARASSGCPSRSRGAQPPGDERCC